LRRGAIGGHLKLAVDRAAIPPVDTTGQRTDSCGGQIAVSLKRLVMHDYALVLNAGSSSLKFCVYWKPEVEDWRLETRGQIEGVGTSPRISAMDAGGRVLIDRKLDARVLDGFNALETLAGWFRCMYGTRTLLASATVSYMAARGTLTSQDLRGPRAGFLHG